MAFDYKKEYQEFYLPLRAPGIVEIPEMNYLAVRGSSDPNDEHGAYKSAVGLLYAVAYTIKMSRKGSHQIPGYFEHVVPPLEGFWWQDYTHGIDYAHKERFSWISVIRLPNFVTKEEFDWSVDEATRKKKDFSKVELLTYAEGLCVQCLHIGSYDDEPETIRTMDEFAWQKGYVIDITGERLHHEINLSDPRKCSVEKQKTVIWHPIRPL